ncbi:UNVERIFIED_CONTAM: hypothetical protein PYX00_002938 [Menopon gallinae]|uniref:Large subunit GTPase 1 homolog n=1 Tax=Menopon gallinae TaxID=328185 RepID=A0AAW2HY26_9NEOP
MGKKNNVNATLGRALIKDRFSKGRNRRQHADPSMLHTTDLNDGYDWGRLNLKSVTEESSFQEFLSTAELAGTEFEAEKLNVKFVKPTATDIVSRSHGEIEPKHREMMKIPRRPRWTQETTASELQNLEREGFLEWRRGLAVLQEVEGFLLTPYEKNLEFWRQLWRVIERSDVVIQIVDARNPLMFRCTDLEKYVKEVDENKENVLLINKADFLSEEQRQAWADYFTKENVKVVFYSAIASEDDEPETDVDKQIERISLDDSDRLKNWSKIYTQEELIRFFRTFHQAPRVTENKTTVGLVGYPNVGKSSTVNSLLNAKKVAVSATPGKTKHFQTFNLDEDLILCDCPGLVMPSFVSTKSDMIINGILPIDQMKDHVPPINLVASLIPRHVLEDTYGLILPKPKESEDPNRAPTSEELLNAFGFNRGFMTQNGQPDNPRSARYILKDFVAGKLLYCHAPPGVEQGGYHTFPERKRVRNLENADKRYVRAVTGVGPTTEDVDRVFFDKNRSLVHERGTKKVLMTSNLTDGDALAMVQNHSGEKPWKQINKHKNKNKREKLRRVYREQEIY